MRNIHFAIGLLVITLLPALATGCGSAGQQTVQAPDTRDDDEVAIRTASKEWSDAEAAKDLPKCLSYYADDAERLSPGTPLITGKEALRREWEKFLAMPGKFRWVTSKVEVARSGDLAYETGAYESVTLDKNKQPVTARGKYVLVWEKQTDGKWKVTEDIDNPDQ